VSLRFKKFSKSFIQIIFVGDINSSNLLLPGLSEDIWRLVKLEDKRFIQGTSLQIFSSGLLVGSRFKSEVKKLVIES
jgi:hypothetical protein